MLVLPLNQVAAFTGQTCAPRSTLRHAPAFSPRMPGRNSSGGAAEGGPARGVPSVPAPTASSASRAWMQASCQRYRPGSCRAPPSCRWCAAPARGPRRELRQQCRKKDVEVAAQSLCGRLQMVMCACGSCGVWWGGAAPNRCSDFEGEHRIEAVAPKALRLHVGVPSTSGPAT